MNYKSGPNPSLKLNLVQPLLFAVLECATREGAQAMESFRLMIPVFISLYLRKLHKLSGLHFLMREAETIKPKKSEWSSADEALSIGPVV